MNNEEGRVENTFLGARVLIYKKLSSVLTTPMAGIHLEQGPTALGHEDRREVDVIGSWTKDAAGSLGCCACFRLQNE